MLKVDKHTKMRDFVRYEAVLADGEAARLKAAAVRDMYGDDGFYAMTLGDFFTVTGGDVRPLGADGTVYATYRVRAFADFVDTFIQSLRRLTPQPTAEQVRQSAGTIPCQFDESVLVFCRSYFGLHSFAEVELLTVADLLLAKKDTYNQAVVERNIAARLNAKGGRP